MNDTVDNKKATEEKPEIPTGTTVGEDIGPNLGSRESITVAKAKKLFRKTPWSDIDLAKKAGISRSSVDKYWRNTIPTNGFAWRSITGFLEVVLGHVRIIKPK